MELSMAKEIALDDDEAEELLGILTAHAQLQRVMRDHDAARETEALRNAIHEQL